MESKFTNLWAVILGGSSGFGLSSAIELAQQGMNICIVHRDRKGSMARIEQGFDAIRSQNVQFCSFNLDALSIEGRKTALTQLQEIIGNNKIRLLLHSIAFGSLKLIAPLNKSTPDLDTLSSIYDSELLLDEQEVLNTIHAMGVSLLGWTQDVFNANLFAPDARIIGLTSEGNSVAWLGYAAVSAAKASLEAISRSIAKEYGPHGIRSNIVQPGITDTAALRLIPGSSKLLAQAKKRNPLGRVTQIEDVAKVIAFLSSDDASWINGSILRVDDNGKWKIQRSVFHVLRR